MKNVKMYVDKDFKIAHVDDRLFSSFIEHLGRAVYTGIYEPEHPSADENGFRMDVIELIKELGVTSVRYPGGNFLSGYNWKNGIGPKKDRPRCLDLAWKTIESNQFGIDEFYDWSQKSGTSIMGAVNMGTGTPKEAGELVEYCNFKGGTYWSDIRTKNGHADPMGIKLWCIGNEMDGDWQICHLDADDYGKKALETAKIMKWVDDSIELVVCGSATSTQKTFPEWDRTVLEHTYDSVDYISLHRYYENEGNDLDFLASFVDMDKFINTITSTVDYVKAFKRSNKTVNLSFDEWNVWYQHKQTPHDWEEAPHILEDHYSVLDALVFAGMGMTLLNHADRVKIACLAQLVNVIAPIFTEKNGKAIKQTIFYPFKYLSLYGRGDALKPVVVTPEVETKYGVTPLLHSSVVYNRQAGIVTIFCLNIDKDDEMLLNLNLRSFGRLSMLEHICVDGEPELINTINEPEKALPRKIEAIAGLRDSFEVGLPKQSWNVLVFKVEEQ